MTQEHNNLQAQSGQAQSGQGQVQPQAQEAQSSELVAGSADQQFEDAGLQRAVQTAFAQVEPSAEAETRMLANLLAYENGIVVQEAALTEVAEEGEEATAFVEAAEDTTATFEAVEGGTSAAQVISAARSAAPKPKRRIRLWQVLIPAAAVLVLAGIALLAVPQISLLNSPTQAATDPASESAQTASETTAKDAETASTTAAESAEAATNVAPELAEMADDVAPESTEYATADSATSETSELMELSAIGADAGVMEEFWARDYPYVVLEDGTQLVLDNPERPSAVPANQVGSVVAEALAQTQDGTASVACMVYRSVESESTYLVAYLGEDIYFPAHEL